MNRKNLLAGAIAVLSGLMMTAVSADVVLGGRLIGAVENIRGGGSNTDANGNTIYVPRTRFNDESSFVRISGIEKLGESVEAGFQIESGFDLSGGSASGDDFKTVNSGNSTSGIATRNSGIFMQGKFGKILFGRWDVFYDTIYLIEPDSKSLPNKVSLLSLFNTPTGGISYNYNTRFTIGADPNFIDIGQLETLRGINSNLGDRYNNVLSYTTPSLAGLQAQLAYVPTNESSTLGTAYNGRIVAGTLTYTPSYFSPLTLVAAGFQQKADRTTTAQDPTNTGTNIVPQFYNLTAGRFGAAVKLPLAEEVTLHIGAVYQTTKLSLDDIRFTLNDFYRRKSFGIPLALMVGPHTVYLTYGHNGKLKLNVNGNVGGTTLNDNPDAGNTDANFYMVGYNYDISKRTAIGAYYAKLKNGSNAAYDFYGNGLNSGGYSFANNLGISPKAMGISFRHLF